MALTPTLVAATVTAVVSMPVVAFGVSLGLQANILVAGFLGSVVAMVLLNTVPSEKPGWLGFVSASVRRLFVAVASSLMAGYFVGGADGFGVSAGVANFSAFVVGAGAQTILPRVIANWSPTSNTNKGA